MEPYCKVLPTLNINIKVIYTKMIFMFGQVVICFIISAGQNTGLMMG